MKKNKSKGEDPSALGRRLVRGGITSIMLHSAVQNGGTQAHSTKHTVLYWSSQYNTVLYSTVMYCTAKCFMGIK